MNLTRARGGARALCGLATASFPLVLAFTPANAAEKPVFSLQQAIGDPADWTVSASVRVRYEALDNQFRPGLDTREDIVLLRTALAAEWHPGPVRIGAELNDSRAYGAGDRDFVSTTEINPLELVQAYVGFDLGSALGKGTRTSLTFGRQTIDLGSRRLVARNNFRNTTNVFTGFKGQVQTTGGATVTAFYTLPVVRLPSDKPSILDNEVEWDHESFDQTFWGVHYGQALGKEGARGGPVLETYFYALKEQDSPSLATRDRRLYTPGARFSRKPAAGRIDYEFEGAYQWGTISASTAPGAARQDVAAWLVHASAGYQFAAPWKPRVEIEYDRASGDRAGGKYNRFDTLFGARRGEFGPTSTYGLLGRSNLSSPGVRLEVTPGKRLDAFVGYRAAWLDSAVDSFASSGVRDGSGASGTFAGHQVEARVRYWLMPKLLRLDTGAAAFFNGRFMKDAPNANGYGDPLFGYVDLTATF